MWAKLRLIIEILPSEFERIVAAEINRHSRSIRAFVKLPEAVDIWDEFTLEFSDHFSVELRGPDIAEAMRFR